MAANVDSIGYSRPEMGGSIRHAEQTGQPRRARSLAKEIVLAVAGIAGLISVLWVVASLAFGISIIVFKTGSMSPTIPTGALAITRPLAAKDITPGEVVTVQVPGQALPVTHRVVSVAPDPGVPGGRSIVLKGDANAFPDQFPYRVTQVKLVVFSAPGLGTALVVLRTPLFLGAGTLVVAALVAWAFWPQRPSVHRAPARRRREPRPVVPPAPTLAPQLFDGIRHDHDR